MISLLAWPHSLGKPKLCPALREKSGRDVGAEPSSKTILQSNQQSRTSVKDIVVRALCRVRQVRRNFADARKSTTIVVIEDGHRITDIWTGAERR